jgi:hypothetical protein
MADSIRKFNYCYLKVPHRAGQGEKILGQLREGGVGLAAFTAFPIKGGAQVDLAPENMADLRRVAKKNGWKLSKVKKGFLIQGTDATGAALKHVKKLAANKINITAADAVSAGKGRYGMMLWVRPKDYSRAARTLKAK